MTRAAAVRALTAALLIFASALSAAETPGPERSDLDALLTRAKELRLAEAPYWRVLLHYRRGVSGLRSQIDDPAFFLAANGKHDPQAELEATISAFYAPAVAGQPHGTDRFPARLEWLVEQLQIERERLPVPRCADIERVLERIQPEGMSLIFPSAYMNSPASLFGHTLLCVRSQFDSKLLDHSINYAADSHETNGLIFAFRGLFGLYDGCYTVVPYYAKVQQYNDIDQRDVWEYRLNLSPAEVRRLMLHVWEVRATRSKYFFFDENCSYVLLYLLDAARPGLELHRQARPWVIPLDTVRLVRDAGLVTTTTYRPSRATHLYDLAAPLSRPQLDRAQAVTRGVQAAATVLEQDWPPPQQARVLDLAAEELRVRLQRQKIPQPVYAKRYIEILTSRNRLQVEPPAEPAHVAPPPDQGHRSMRLSLGAGVEGGRGFSEFSLRPAYHDELDPGLGYLPGSQIEFMGVVLRHYEGESTPDLQRLDALRVQSLAPYDRFFHPISWKADVGLRRDPCEDDEAGALIGHTSLGAGAAWRLGRQSIVYALPEAEAQAGELDAGWALGGGGSAGVYWQIAPSCRLQLGSRALYFPLGEHHADVEAWIAQRWQVTTHQALSLRLGVHRAHDETQSTTGLSWHWYF